MQFVLLSRDTVLGKFLANHVATASNWQDMLGGAWHTSHTGSYVTCARHPLNSGVLVWRCGVAVWCGGGSCGGQCGAGVYGVVWCGVVWCGVVWCGVMV